MKQSNKNQKKFGSGHSADRMRPRSFEISGQEKNPRKGRFGGDSTSVCRHCCRGRPDQERRRSHSSFEGIAGEFPKLSAVGSVKRTRAVIERAEKTGEMVRGQFSLSMKFTGGTSLSRTRCCRMWSVARLPH